MHILHPVAYWESVHCLCAWPQGVRGALGRLDHPMIPKRDTVSGDNGSNAEDKFHALTFKTHVCAHTHTHVTSLKCHFWLDEASRGEENQLWKHFRAARCGLTV